MPIQSLDGRARLMKTDLSLSLNATCRAVVLASAKRGAELDENAVEFQIPGEVFEVAVRAKWLVPPKTARSGSVRLGAYAVSKSYRDEFMSILEPTYEEMELRQYQLGWMQPTPSQLLKQFKYLTGWSDQRVADEVRKLYSADGGGRREPISVKTIRRIQSTTGIERHNARPVILMCLAQVMRNARPKDLPFSSIHWHLLRWRRIRPVED